VIAAAAPPRAGPWRRRRIAEAAIGAAILALGAILPAGRPLPFDLCLWHRITGLRCLGCGMTRSICHLMQGDPAGSLALHPAGPVVVVLIAWLVLQRTSEALAGAPLAEILRRSR
jgi:hypothetical protein